MSNSMQKDPSALDPAKGFKGHFQAAQLFHAANRNKTQLLERLLVEGVSPHIQGYGSEMRQPDGKSALHVATLKGHDASMALLLKHGARVNQPDIWGRTPMDEWAQWMVGKIIRDVPFYERAWNVITPGSLEKHLLQRQDEIANPKTPLSQRKEHLLDHLSSKEAEETPFDWSPFEKELRCLEMLKNAGGKGTHIGANRLRKIHWTWEHVEKGLAWLSATTLKQSLEKGIAPAVDSTSRSHRL